MPLHETESIVLRSYDLAEADRIVVFFTRQSGVIRGVAKGARRAKSKFGSSLEPFSEITLEYFEKEDRELVSVRRADLLRSAFAAASDPNLFETYSNMIDRLIGFAQPHDPNETLFRMVRACLRVDVSNSRDHKMLTLYFDIWLLRLGGFLPDWTICNSCRRPFSEIESASLAGGFNLFCGTCSKSHSGTMISPAQRCVIYDAQKLTPPDFVSRMRTRQEIVNEISVIVDRLISAALGRENNYSVRATSDAG